jgi:hypothetical protein
MLGSVNPNAGAGQPIETKVSVEASKPSPPSKAEVPAITSTDDVVEISSVSKDFQAYRAALDNVPDIRPAVIAEMNVRLSPARAYPPLQVLQGLAKLFGGLVAQSNPSDTEK